MPGSFAMQKALLIGLGFIAAATMPIGAVQGTATDSLIALVEEARSSVCFRAPSRPPTAPPPASSVAAAVRGEPASMAMVAESYLADGDPNSMRKGLAWLERAAAAGLGSAAGEAGQVYASGHGVLPDAELAAQWWRYGAALGDARSMACLSMAYLLGKGTVPDPVEAARWALLRDARTRGRSLLRPTASEFEQALPAADMLEARQRATEDLPPYPSPIAILPGPVASGTGSSPPDLSTTDVVFHNAGHSSTSDPAPQSLSANGSTAFWPAAWGATPAALPRPPKQGASANVGTGIVVASPGVVLTAAHVLQACTDIEIQAGLARLGGGEIRATNLRLDLALVVVPGLERPSVSVAGETRLGAEVIVMGFPGQGIPTERPVVTLGNVSALGAGAVEDIMQFTAPIQAGNSGGPLLDRRGQIIGIAIMSRNASLDIFAGLNVPQNVNIAVAPDAVSRFLLDHGVPFADPGPAMQGVPALVEKIERSVVRVLCHTNRPAKPKDAARHVGAGISTRR